MKYIGYIIGSILAAAFVGWLLGNIPIFVVIVVLVWIFYGISRIPKSSARVPLYALVVLLVGVGWYKGWFANHMPLSSKTLQTLPTRVDVAIAKATFDPGVPQDSGMLKTRQIIDSLHNEAFQRKLGVLQEAVRQGLFSPDSALKILNDSLAIALSSYEAEQARKAFRPTVQNQHSDEIYLVVDVANEDGITYKIQRGKTAHIRIDSAWYNCNFAIIGIGDSRWCNSDGYPISSMRYRKGAAFGIRFLNRNEYMGCVLIFTEQNPKGYRLPMGQTIVVPGGTVTIAVNDWRGGVFGGIGIEGMALSSDQIQRGGFHDNQGYLRVLIVLNPKY